MFLLLLYSAIVIALLVGMICTFGKPRIWKYNTLIGSELFVILCWTAREAYLQTITGVPFRPTEEIYIVLGRPIVILMLIITVIVCLCTRYRWCFKKDPPGFCE